MPRKGGNVRNDSDARVLGVTPAELKRRMKRYDKTVRGLAKFCQHGSHTHILRLTNGQQNRTSKITADYIEAALHAEGLLFVPAPVRSDVQTVAVVRTATKTAKKIPAPRRGEVAA